MSHIRYRTSEGEINRWSIDRENLRFCVRMHCPHMSFGTCLKPKCILKKEQKGKVINFKH